VGRSANIVFLSETVQDKVITPGGGAVGVLVCPDTTVRGILALEELVAGIASASIFMAQLRQGGATPVAVGVLLGTLVTLFHVALLFSIPCIWR